MFDRNSYSKLPIPIEAELKTLFSSTEAITIFEIGACEGEDSIKYSRLFKNASIYAFEPLPQNIERAKKNISDHQVKNVTIYNKALSSKPGTATFYVSDGRPETAPESDWDYGNKSSSLLQPDKHNEMAPFITFDKKIEVETITLQDFCSEQHIKSIHYIHMDVQGAEMMVLHGAGDYISAIKAIWIEVSNVHLYKDQPLAKDIDSFLTKNNFVLTKDCLEGMQGDRLYISKTFYPHYEDLIQRQIHNPPIASTAYLNRLRRLKRKLVSSFAKASKLIRKILNINTTQILIGNEQYKFKVLDDLLWAFPNGDYYEKNVIHFLDRIISSYDKPVFVDVGANCGYYSVKYSSHCSHIYAFEPVDKTHKILAGNIKANELKNVTLFQNGLSDVDEKLEINLYNTSANDSIFDRQVPADHPLKKTGTQTIQLKNLDDLVKTGIVGIPSIFKIDVEGAELKVLKGAKSTINKYRPTVVFEYSANTAADAGYDKELLLTVLELKDYNIYGIAEDEQDFTLVNQKDFDNKQVANLIFIPAEIDTYLN